VLFGQQILDEHEIRVPGEELRDAVYTVASDSDLQSDPIKRVPQLPDTARIVVNQEDVSGHGHLDLVRERWSRDASQSMYEALAETQWKKS
jgi:hypothetical protein